MDAKTRMEREASMVGLLAAFARRDFAFIRPSIRRDVTLTLAGSSRLAGTYEGYGAFEGYVKVLRDVLTLTRQPIEFSHPSGETMVFRQVLLLSGPQHDVETAVVTTVGYDESGKIVSFVVEPEDQGLFDHVVDTSAGPQVLA